MSTPGVRQVKNPLDRYDDGAGPASDDGEKLAKKVQRLQLTTQFETRPIVYSRPGITFTDVAVSAAAAADTGTNFNTMDAIEMQQMQRSIVDYPEDEFTGLISHDEDPVEEEDDESLLVNDLEEYVPDVSEEANIETIKFYSDEAKLDNLISKLVENPYRGLKWLGSKTRTNLEEIKCITGVEIDKIIEAKDLCIFAECLLDTGSKLNRYSKKFIEGNDQSKKLYRKLFYLKSILLTDKSVVDKKILIEKWFDENQDIIFSNITTICIAIEFEAINVKTWKKEVVKMTSNVMYLTKIPDVINRFFRCADLIVNAQSLLDISNVKLSSLRTLVLDCPLVSISESFNIQFPHMAKLEIRRNSNIINIKGAINISNSLTCLKIIDCPEFNSIDPLSFQMLLKLEISKCPQFRSLEGINLSNLHTLILDCPYLILPDDFSQRFQNIVKLKIINNSVIESAEDKLNRCMKLTELRITNCKKFCSISKLKIDSLIRLYVTYCMLQHIGNEFPKHNTKLKKIVLHHNKLVRLPYNFRNFAETGLEVLDISGNLFKDVPASFDQLYDNCPVRKYFDPATNTFKISKVSRVLIIGLVDNKEEFKRLCEGVFSRVFPGNYEPNPFEDGDRQEMKERFFPKNYEDNPFEKRVLVV